MVKDTITAMNTMAKVVNIRIYYTLSVNSYSCYNFQQEKCGYYAMSLWYSRSEAIGSIRNK